MFRQDFTCPALLMSVSTLYPYGAVTHYGSSFQRILVKVKTALA